MDDSYDSDFPYPHLDPPELNDLPDNGEWVGDKPKVEHRHGDSELTIKKDDGTISIEEIPF